MSFVNYSWAIHFNNPFGLIQKSPDNWKGLIGNDGGRLQFADNVFGARAGFINLVNTYLKRGKTTPAEIMPIYAPKGHGSNDPKKYIELVEKFSGIKPNQSINNEQLLYKLGQAITRIERGNPLDSKSLAMGLELAIEAFGGKIPTMGKRSYDSTTSGSGKLVSIAALLFGLGFLIK
jgi:hypothetical protein